MAFTKVQKAVWDAVGGSWRTYGRMPLTPPPPTWRVTQLTGAAVNPPGQGFGESGFGEQPFGGPS